MGLSQIGQFALRGLQFLWTLLLMSLIGNMIAQRVGGSPSVVNYAMFAAVIAMLSLFYLIPAAFIESLRFNKFILVAIDGVLTFVWLTCGIALAAELHAHSCGDVSYVRHNRITNGTRKGNQAKRCHEAQASTAFLWFGFACFAASMALDFIGGSGGASRRGPMSKA